MAQLTTANGSALSMAAVLLLACGLVALFLLHPGARARATQMLSKAVRPGYLYAPEQPADTSEQAPTDAPNPAQAKVDTFDYSIYEIRSNGGDV